MVRGVSANQPVYPRVDNDWCMQLVVQHRQLSLPDSSLTEVSLALGDLKDGLGLHADSQQLHQQALQLSQHECSCLGLPERQVSPMSGALQCYLHQGHNVVVSWQQVIAVSDVFSDAEAQESLACQQP